MRNSLDSPRTPRGRPSSPLVIPVLSPAREGSSVVVVSLHDVVSAPLSPKLKAKWSSFGDRERSGQHATSPPVSPSSLASRLAAAESRRIAFLNWVAKGKALGARAAAAGQSGSVAAACDPDPGGGDVTSDADGGSSDEDGDGAADGAAARAGHPRLGVAACPLRQGAAPCRARDPPSLGPSAAPFPLF